MTYARARLWTGISGVGTVVVLAVLALALGLPDRLPALVDALLETDTSLVGDALGFALVIAAGALALLPFDLLGGWLLPRAHGRPHLSGARFALAWIRGVLVLLAVGTCSGTLLLSAGRAGGLGATLAAFVALAAVLLAVQEPLARLVGGLRRADIELTGENGEDLRDEVVVLESDDPGFTGGFSGWTGRLVLPARWARALAPDELRLLVERRRAIRSSGAWHLGLALAVAWNTLGFALASTLPGAGVASLPQLVTTALGFTVWTFLGLLLLPTPSRRATAAADAQVAPHEPARTQLLEVVRFLDSLQDDEPERSPGVESVFHPIPSVASRGRALERPRAIAFAPWNLARTALYLSHAGLSLLPRAVHCNAGRPQLWVYLPADG